MFTSNKLDGPFMVYWAARCCCSMMDAFRVYACSPEACSHSTITQTLKWANTVQWRARGVGFSWWTFFCVRVSPCSQLICVFKQQNSVCSFEGHSLKDLNTSLVSLHKTPWVWLKTHTVILSLDAGWKVFTVFVVSMTEDCQMLEVS